MLVTPRPDTRTSPSVPPRLRTSIRMVMADPALLLPLVVVGIVGLASDPVSTLTPAFSTEIFGRPDTFTGILVGAFGAGAVTAAFVVTGRVVPSYRLLSVTLGAMGVGIVSFSLAGSEAIAMFGLFIAGFGYVATVTAGTSLLHQATEESHRGRIMSLWSLSFHGSRPVGSLLDGTIASLAGIRVAGLVMAVPTVIGCIAFAVLVRRGTPTRSEETSSP
jgi:predicted MFS family arabinose efflux permease